MSISGPSIVFSFLVNIVLSSHVVIERSKLNKTLVADIATEINLCATMNMKSSNMSPCILHVGKSLFTHNTSYPRVRNIDKVFYQTWKIKNIM